MNPAREFVKALVYPKKGQVFLARKGKTCPFFAYGPISRKNRGLDFIRY
jgi:hypothetical protein